jgi:hypothetical protein
MAAACLSIASLQAIMPGSKPIGFNPVIAGKTMGSFSILHWIIFFLLAAKVASPVFGVVRGVKNHAVVHAIASLFVPMYGLIYFFAARSPREPSRG